MQCTLGEHLSGLNTDILKSWLRRVDALEKGMTRKDDFIRAISEQLSNNLSGILKRLNLAERCFLAQCAHQRRFVSAREFEAKYNTVCPLPSMTISYRDEASLLVPFFHIPAYRNYADACLVADMEEPIRALLAPPPGVESKPVSHVPTAWPSEVQCQGTDLIRPVHIHESERIAPVELGRVLRLVQAGKLKVTDAAKRPTNATTRLTTESLVVPDFDLEIPESHCNEWNSRYYTSCGSVRPHAWPVLIQQCGWARGKEGTLALTADGLSILGEFTPEKFRAGVSRLFTDDNFDELNRIDHIRGQSGKAKRFISKPSQRKLVVKGALKTCLINQWLAYPEVCRIVNAFGKNWDVLSTQSPALYFFEPQYGWICDNHGLCSQFLRAFLMESLSTLGIIDVAYIYPHRLWPDLKDSLNGDLAFCSRYDGLLYVRITPLGAYALDITDHCDFRPDENPKLFHVVSRSELVLPHPLDPANRASLELMAERQNDMVWSLDVERILSHVETGGSLKQLRSFLETNASEALPEDVQDFLVELEERIGAFRSQRDAVLLEWADERLAQLLATSTETGKLCFHCGENRLVVAKSNLGAFSRAVKKLGFVVPHVR